MHVIAIFAVGPARLPLNAAGPAGPVRSWIHCFKKKYLSELVLQVSGGRVTFITTQDLERRGVSFSMA
jgi:hypothetical protein